MKKSLRSTLILTALFIGLVLWYQIYEKRLKPKGTEAEEKTKQIFALSKDDVQELTIERLVNPPKDDAPPGTPPTSTDYSKVKLKLSGTDWNLIEPVQDQADNATVASMVASLTTTKQERVVDESPKDIEPFGLKLPLIKITASKSGGKPETVIIGSNTPTGFSSYVRVSEDPKIYRVTRSLRTSFDKDLKSLRNKAIVGWTRSDVTEVEIQTQKESFILKKPLTDKEDWVLAREQIPADTTEWNKTLNAILEMKATDFAAEDAKQAGKFGLGGKPQARIQLVKKDAKKLNLSVGKVGEKIYVRRDDRPTIYEVDKDLLKKVDASPTTYRSLRVANFNRFDIKRVKIERGKEILELLKEDKGGWTMPIDPKLVIDGTKVDSLLTVLQDTKLTKYLTTRTTDTSPQLVIRLIEKKEKDEKERVSLTFTKPQGKLVTVSRSDLDIPFQVKVDDFKKFDLSQKDFLKVEEKKDEKQAAKADDKKS